MKNNKFNKIEKLLVKLQQNKQHTIISSKLLKQSTPNIVTDSFTYWLNTTYDFAKEKAKKQLQIAQDKIENIITNKKQAEKTIKEYFNILSKCQQLFESYNLVVRFNKLYSPIVPDVNPNNGSTIYFTITKAGSSSYSFNQKSIQKLQEECRKLTGEKLFIFDEDRKTLKLSFEF